MSEAYMSVPPLNKATTQTLILQKSFSFSEIYGAKTDKYATPIPLLDLQTLEGQGYTGYSVNFTCTLYGKYVNSPRTLVFCGIGTSYTNYTPSFSIASTRAEFNNTYYSDGVNTHGESVVYPTMGYCISNYTIDQYGEISSIRLYRYLCITFGVQPTDSAGGAYGYLQNGIAYVYGYK